jgi:hypothetical protein
MTQRQDRQAVAIAMVAGIVGVLILGSNYTLPTWSMVAIVIGWELIVIGLVMK